LSNPADQNVAPGGGGWRVLTIDEDPLFLEIVQVCLERLGCTVQTESNPNEGLDAAIQGEHDLVLLDLKMAGMVGEEIFSLLKPLSLRQKVVVVSGQTEQEGHATPRNLGAA
jgi:CheY-like chemotaxis protein